MLDRSGKTRVAVHNILSNFLSENGAAELPPLTCPSTVTKTELDWTSGERFAVSYLRRELFRKCEWLEFGIDKRRACLDALVFMEDHCRTVNGVWDGGIPACSERDALLQVRHNIYRVLGASPPTLDKLPLTLGPGATYDCRSGTPVDGKLHKNGGITSTPQLARRVGAISSTIPGLDCYHLVPGARFATVPKTALTDRPIEVPPTFNAMVQRAYGKAIRRCLFTRTGINLRTAQDRHKEILAARSGDFATIDFESASDSIAHNVIVHLFPERWVDALDDARCHRVLIDDKWVELERFSSMGNGFTFEVMTLLLWAAAKAVGSVEPLVFGDDVIIERELHDRFIALTRVLGFKVNSEKTFFDGPFRESCGYDVFGGLCVTPFRIRKRDFSHPLDLVWLHNEIVCWSERTGITVGVKAACHSLRRLFPMRPLLGPLSRGDRWFSDNQDAARPSVKRAWNRLGTLQWEGVLVKGWFRDFRMVEKPCRDPGLLRRNITPAYSASLKDVYDSVSVPKGPGCEGYDSPPQGYTVATRRKPVVSTSWTVVLDWPQICAFVLD